MLKRARAEVHGVPELADGRDLVAAVSAFTTVLDPHTTLLPNAAFNGTTTGNAYGFDFDGEALGRAPRHRPVRRARSRTTATRRASRPLPFRVAVVKPGSPAQKAGLRPGDLVRQIDGIAADARTAAKAFAGLHGAGPDKAQPGRPPPGRRAGR